MRRTEKVQHSAPTDSSSWLTVTVRRSLPRYPHSFSRKVSHFHFHWDTSLLSALLFTTYLQSCCWNCKYQSQFEHCSSVCRKYSQQPLDIVNHLVCILNTNASFCLSFSRVSVSSSVVSITVFQSVLLLRRRCITCQSSPVVIGQGFEIHNQCVQYFCLFLSNSLVHNYIIHLPTIGHARVVFWNSWFVFDFDDHYEL
jgi:hypothetical protein